MGMGYNELYAKAFQYGMMFGKDIKPGDEVRVSVTEIDDIVLAVKKAYIDMSPRTFKNNGSEGGESLDPQKKEALFKHLAKKISDYMKNGADDFETWHHKLCEYFIKEFSAILEEAGKNPIDATYGKAQKIVNMTFKYLYCFDDAPAYAERFEPCHMALDSYILSWVSEWFIAQYNKEKPKEKKLSKSGKNQLPKWSHMAYKAENDSVPQYIEIQDAIKKKVEEDFHKPPIEAEFEIWYDARKKAEKKG
jgi:hypothetical protein